jgi:hypothetical protein
VTIILRGWCVAEMFRPSGNTLGAGSRVRFSSKILTKVEMGS